MRRNVVDDDGHLAEPAPRAEGLRLEQPVRRHQRPLPVAHVRRPQRDAVHAEGAADAKHIGAVGHSLGARVSSYLQDPRYDQAGSTPRIHATVGLDNISSDYYGDTSAGGGDSAVNDAVVGQPLPPPGGEDTRVHITAPGLGLASDNTTSSDPELKKAAFVRWRESGVPSGMFVFKGVVHDDFSQSAQSDEPMIHRFAYMTLAWFDLWLKKDRSATERLLARSIVGVETKDLLSTTQHSAWFLPKYGTDDYLASLS